MRAGREQEDAVMNGRRDLGRARPGGREQREAVPVPVPVLVLLPSRNRGQHSV